MSSLTNIVLKKLAPATDLEKIAFRIRARNKSYLVDTGKDLLQARGMLAHGEFGPWLKANFDWSISTAQNLMNVARMVEKNPKFGNFEVVPVSETGA